MENMLRIAGRGNDGKAKAIKTDNVGNIGVQVVGGVVSQSIYDAKVLAYESYPVDGANTLIVNIMVGGIDDKGIYLTGFVKGSSIPVRIPFVDSNRILRNDYINQVGIFYADIMGYESVRINRYTSGSLVEAICTLSTSESVKAVDSPVRYRRITPQDDLVRGRFRAIEPLTDIELSSQCRFIITGADDLERYTFKDGDKRLTGHTLHGHFDLVKITSGVALLVLL